MGDGAEGWGAWMDGSIGGGTYMSRHIKEKNAYPYEVLSMRSQSSKMSSGRRGDNMTNIYIHI